jgi:hypothetical protein
MPRVLLDSFINIILIITYNYLYLNLSNTGSTRRVGFAKHDVGFKRDGIGKARFNCLDICLRSHSVPKANVHVHSRQVPVGF